MRNRKFQSKLKPFHLIPGGPVFFLRQRHQFTCSDVLYSFSFENELKALSKSLKNWAHLYLACPEPGVFLGLLIKLNQVVENTKVCQDKLIVKTLLLFLMRSIKRWLESLSEGLIPPGWVILFVQKAIWSLWLWGGTPGRTKRPTRWASRSSRGRFYNLLWPLSAFTSLVRGCRLMPFTSFSSHKCSVLHPVEEERNLHLPLKLSCLDGSSFKKIKHSRCS